MIYDIQERQQWIRLIFSRAFGYRELGIDKMLLNLDHEGQIIWEPGLITQTICEVNIAKYPFDSQHCSIRVMSWMHTNRSLQVSVASNSIDTTNYYPNGEWDLRQGVFPRGRKLQRWRDPSRRRGHHRIKETPRILYHLYYSSYFDVVTAERFGVHASDQYRRENDAGCDCVVVFHRLYECRQWSYAQNFQQCFHPR